MGTQIPRVQVAHRSGGRLMTKVAEQEQSDVNVIMRRWLKNGIVPVTGQKPRYGEFHSGVDFHSGLNAVMAAQTEFERLPALVRKRCDNDPGSFLELVGTTEGIEELVELGLQVDQVPDALRVEVVDPPVTESEPEGGDEAAVS